LDALRHTLSGKLEYELLIIDDCSKDDTVDFLKGLGAGVRTFFNEENRGFAKNNNFLAREAKGKYLCFLNNDVFVEGDWLSPMIKAMEVDKNIGIVGNVQKIAGSKRFDHMGVVFSPNGNPRHFGQGFFYRPYQGKTRSWSAVTAACCLIQRSYFLDIGGFDENFVNGCEDVDLCLRITNDNKSCVVVHDSVVQHVKGASEGRKKFNDKNFELLYQKWGESILTKEAVADQQLHAFTYFYRGIIKPYSINGWKWMQAVLILLRIITVKPR
jgi:GT2 family glycosyltransferase